jgi:hypothetical protein
MAKKKKEIPKNFWKSHDIIQNLPNVILGRKQLRKTTKKASLIREIEAERNMMYQSVLKYTTKEHKKTVVRRFNKYYDQKIAEVNGKSKDFTYRLHIPFVGKRIVKISEKDLIDIQAGKKNGVLKILHKIEYRLKKIIADKTVKDSSREGAEKMLNIIRTNITYTKYGIGRGEMTKKEMARVEEEMLSDKTPHYDGLIKINIIASNIYVTI